MKLAVCLFGISYKRSKEFWGHKTHYDIDWRQSLINYEDYLYYYFRNKGYDIDFYLCSNKSVKQEEVVKTIKPKKYLFVDEVCEEFNKISAVRTIERHKKVSNVLKLIEGEYDTILLTRFDLLFNIKLDQLKLDLDCMNIISQLTKTRQDSKPMGICDNLYIFPFTFKEDFIKLHYTTKKAHYFEKGIEKFVRINYMNEENNSMPFKTYSINRIHFKVKDSLKTNWVEDDWTPPFLIPKTIYQTYLGTSKDTLPPAYIENIEFIKSQNPDWEYKLYRDDDVEAFISNNYPPSYLETYHKINSEYGAARADFFRYLIIYKNGGVYMDMKSAPRKPLSTIIKKDDEFIFSHWSSHPHKEVLNYPLGEIQNWFIMAKPKHPFLKKVIDKIVRNINSYDPDIDGVGKKGTINTTGPIVYSKTIIPLLKDHKHTQYQSNQILGMSYARVRHYKRICNYTHYSKLTSPLVIS